jgi:prolipoprotein diacylglyceryl transferase
MLPYLFQIGSLRVPTHDFFVLLGTLAATAVFLYEARRRRMLSERLLGVMLGTLLCGALGARLATLPMYVEAAPEPSVVGALIDGGKSILGGLAGAYLGAHLFKRLLGFRARTGDLFAPAVALGMAVGRWGCFLTEQIGTPTDLPWGIAVAPQQALTIPNCPGCISGARMHPSFLYEIAFHLVMFALIWWWLRPRVFVNGELLKIYLLAYAVFRFAVEFVRGNEAVWNGLSRSQLFLIPSAALLLLYFARQWLRGIYRVPQFEGVRLSQD